MKHNEIIDSFQSSFPKGFIRDDIVNKILEDFQRSEFEYKNSAGYELESNLRPDELKRALLCKASGIDEELLSKILPAIEYTDMLICYYRKYVVPIQELKTHHRNPQGSIDKANDLIDLAKARSDQETLKALESFRDTLVEVEEKIQLTEMRIFDNFLYWTALLCDEVTEKIRPKKKLLNAVNYLIKEYFHQAKKSPYGAGIEIDNFLQKTFKYHSFGSFEVMYSPKRAGR